MKKLILSSLALITAQLITAQTLTQANHAPAVGNKIYKTVQIDSTGITPGASGLGVTWNYPTITMHTSLVQTFTTSALASASFPMADVSVSSGTANVSNYKASATGLDYYGGVIVANGVSININYNTPAKAAQYPFTAVSTLTSAVGGTLSVFGMSGNFTGNVSVLAGATGSLTIGTRTFTDVIRLTTTSVLSGTLTFGTVGVNQVVNEYYSISQSKAPVFTISNSTLTSISGTSTQTFVTTLQDYLTVGVKESAKNSIELALFPNPSNSILNFNTQSTDAVKVIAYDVTGRIVTTELFENGKIKLDVSTLNAGIYMYSVLSKSNEVLKTGKFNVTK